VTPPFCRTASPPPASAELDAYFADLGLGVNPWLERYARRRALSRLQACSDAELGAAGLACGDIPARVFADRFDRWR
jgi:hypothetical protein